MRPSYIQINLSNLKHNLRELRKHVGNVQIMPVLKANAYGHGIIECAHALEAEGIDSIGVAFIEEAIDLRTSGIKSPILPLGGICKEQIPLFFDYKVDFLASSLEKLEAIEAEAKQRNAKARIHIKIDTGMERIGVHHYSKFLPELIKKATSTPELSLVGISTHFSNSETILNNTVEHQLLRFKKALAPFQTRIPKSTLIHTANSGAVLSFPNSHESLVRPGLVTFGISPSEFPHPKLSLKPCLELLSEVVYFKVIKEGSSVSYNSTWTSDAQTRIVTIPLGYADGISRHLSNQGEVLIRGKRFPIVGNICMDQFMVDIGPNGEAYLGDKVTLIGSDGDESISVWDIAKKLDTDPREVLTMLNCRLPRRFIS